MVLALIKAGCGISVMPALRLRHVGREVCIKQLNPPIYRRIMIAIRAKEARNPSLCAFIDVLQEAARDFMPSQGTVGVA